MTVTKEQAPKALDIGFKYEGGVHTPTVLVGFAPDDWAARDRFVRQFIEQSQDSGHAPAPAPQQQPTDATGAMASAWFGTSAPRAVTSVFGSPTSERDLLLRIIAKHDAWAAQMPQGDFDDPLSDAINAARAALAGAAPTPQPDTVSRADFDAKAADLERGKVLLERVFNMLPAGHPARDLIGQHTGRWLVVFPALGAAPTQAPQQPVAYTKLAEYEVMAGCYHLSEPAAQWTRKLPEGKYVICATPTEGPQQPAPSRKCLYCERDMIPGSECLSKAQSESCDLLQRKFCEVNSLPAASVAVAPDNRISVDRGALQMALNVLCRAGKNEVADALAESADAGVGGTRDQTIPQQPPMKP